MLNKPTNYAELIKIPAKLMIIILKVISVTPTQHTKWESITFYTHTHTHTPSPHTHVGQGDRHGSERDSLEIVIEQVSLEGDFKRGRRSR